MYSEESQILVPDTLDTLGPIFIHRSVRGRITCQTVSMHIVATFQNIPDPPGFLRLIGITKCVFDNSSTILDLPMPDDWMMVA